MSRAPSFLCFVVFCFGFNNRIKEKEDEKIIAKPIYLTLINHSRFIKESLQHSVSKAEDVFRDSKSREARLCDAD